MDASGRVSGLDTTPSPALPRCRPGKPTRKDVSTVGADPQGKQEHVVETLNIVDSGTSVLLDAQVRDDFSAEVALQALVPPLQRYGCPASLTVDRDPRWVGSREAQ